MGFPVRVRVPPYPFFHLRGGKGGEMKKRIGELLLDIECINRNRLNKALKKQNKISKMIGEVLILLGYVNEEVVLSLLGKQLGYPYISLSEFDDFQPEIVKEVPYEIAKRELLVPLKKEKGCLVVAMAYPQRHRVKVILEKVIGCKIKPCIASKNEIKSFIEKYYEY